MVHEKCSLLAYGAVKSRGNLLFCPENWGSTFIRIVGTFPSQVTASQPRTFLIAATPSNPKPQLQRSFFLQRNVSKSRASFILRFCPFNRPWWKTKPWDSSHSLFQRHWVQPRVVLSTTWRKWVLYADVSVYGFTWMGRTPVRYMHHISETDLAYDE